jgi:hypothetical protein
LGATFVSISSANSLAQSEPSGATAGDLLVAIIGASAAPTNPGGWTQIGTTQTESSYSYNVWYIVRGGSAPSLTWGGGGGSPVGSVACYRGVPGTSPLDASATQTVDANDDVSPSVTTSVANGVLICFLGDNNTSSFTAPSGMTLRTTNRFEGIADKQLGAAGATGSQTWGSVSQPVSAWTAAFKPATTGRETVMRGVARGVARGVR